MLKLRPLSFKDAKAFVVAQHRHHKPPQGHKFSIGLDDDGEIVGVSIVGRPIARHLDDGYTAEVTRLCTDGTMNACSKLYAASWRAAKAMGYRRMITYILESEPGISLRASGWQRKHTTPGRSWSTPSRPREDTHPLGPKVMYEIRETLKEIDADK